MESTLSELSDLRVLGIILTIYSRPFSTHTRDQYITILYCYVNDLCKFLLSFLKVHIDII